MQPGRPCATTTSLAPLLLLPHPKCSGLCPAVQTPLLDPLAEPSLVTVASSAKILPLNSEPRQAPLRLLSHQDLTSPGQELTCRPQTMKPLSTWSQAQPPWKTEPRTEKHALWGRDRPIPAYHGGEQLRPGSGQDFQASVLGYLNGLSCLFCGSRRPGKVMSHKEPQKA